MKLVSVVMVLFVYLFGALSITASYAPEATEVNLQIKDYGIRGHLFEIEEESMLEEIMAKLEIARDEGRIDELQAAFIKKVEEKILKPKRVNNIAKATKSRSWYFDTSFTQEEAIIDDKGNIIVHAGTKVNPLDKVEWGESLVFIDGEDEAQVAWASNQKGKITLINGAPLELAKTLSRPIFFDQAGLLCRKFNIENVPAIVKQTGKMLMIQEIKI